MGFSNHCYGIDSDNSISCTDTGLHLVVFGVRVNCLFVLCVILICIYLIIISYKDINMLRNLSIWV